MTMPAAKTARARWAEHERPGRTPAAGSCRYRDLGLMSYLSAWDVQRKLVERRKTGQAEDHLLLVEHPPVISMGRNARKENLLLSEEQYAALGIDLQHTDRGGDVTYHGPGQVVGYPVLHLREWKCDVVAYVRALEEVIIDAVRDFGIPAGRLPGCTGVWVEGAKLAAIGVHISRWVTSHGFALNLAPRMECFGYIVPCGLDKPVVSMEQLLGQAPPREEVLAALIRSFGKVFDRCMLPAAEAADPPAVAERQ